MSPMEVTSRLRVTWPESGKGIERLTARVRCGLGATWETNRRVSGPERCPGPSRVEGNAYGPEEAVGPGSPGPIGVRVAPWKLVAIPPVPLGMSRVRACTSSTTCRTTRRAVRVPLVPVRPSADWPVTRIETARVVLARRSFRVPWLAGPANRSWFPLGPPNPQSSTAEIGSEAS